MYFIRLDNFMDACILYNAFSQEVMISVAGTFRNSSDSGFARFAFQWTENSYSLQKSL